jgi:hypothetical protein
MNPSLFLIEKLSVRTARAHLLQGYIDDHFLQARDGLKGRHAEKGMSGACKKQRESREIDAQSHSGECRWM